MRQIGLITVSVATVGSELTSKGQYTFTRQGKPLSKDITLDDNQCNYSHTMEYDSSGFMKKETVSGPYIGFHNQRTAVEYNYNSLGQIASKYFDIRTTVEYTYNLRGQVTSIQSPFFSQNIKYETGTTPCYNGNISEYTVSYNGGEAVKRTFSYDRMNRLTAMTSSDGFNTAYTYNLNSSPLTIQRYGLTSDGTVGLVDDLTMTYSGNQLTRVDDAADPVILENSSDFHSAEAEYSYDSDGRLIADTGRGITNIEYSPIGKPLKIKTMNGQTTYAHFADGSRYKKTWIPRVNSKADQLTQIYEDVFEFSLRYGAQTRSLEFMYLPWGYIKGMDVHVYIQDYQGNNRTVVDQMRCAVQTTDYYPYGMPMSTSYGAAENAYKYSGKEFETRLGLNQYDFATRIYIPALAMFAQPDPLAFMATHLTPFHYCSGDPINRIDPTGLTDIYDPATGRMHWENDGINAVYEVSSDEFDSLLKLNFSRNSELYKTIISQECRINHSLFPTVVDVLKNSKFIAWNDMSAGNNCYPKAQKQNNCNVNTGKKINTYPTSIYNPSASTEYIKYINGQLVKGKSVMVGVNETGGPKKDKPNQNKYTEHFINLVGQGFEIIDGVPLNYFSYYDNGVSDDKDGRNIVANRLYYKLTPLSSIKIFIDENITQRTDTRVQIKHYILTEVLYNYE